MNVKVKGDKPIYIEILESLGYVSVPVQEKNGMELGIYEDWEGIIVTTPIARDMYLIQQAQNSKWRESITLLGKELGLELEWVYD